jgi:hypothetical protein
MKLLETEWIGFRNAAIPKDAGSTQLTEMRRAFFAGAWAIYSLMMNSLEPDKEPTDGDLRMMAALDAEMREFASRVKKGWA